MPEQLPQPEEHIENSLPENEVEKEIVSPQTKYYEWAEKHYQNRYDEYDKKFHITIPETERQVEEVGDYGYRMRIKNMPDVRPSSFTEPQYKDNNRHRTTEYFFDFDDTLFNTTEYNNAIWKNLEILGLSKKEINAIYESSKIANEKTGREMYNQDAFIEKLVSKFPDKEEEIKNAFNVNHEDFIHKDMAQLIRVLTSSPISRIHILTFGDIDVQKQKVEAVLKKYGMPMDVLYTQVPKAEFLTSYLPEQYPYIEGEDANMQNFVVIDDSVSEIKELIKLGKKTPFLTPLRLRKPEAKKSKEEQGEENRAYEITNEFASVLLDATQSFREFRSGGKTTKKEWLSENIAEKIRKRVDLLKSHSDEFEIRDGEDGTIIISRKVYNDPNVDKVTTFENEVGFDDVSEEMYEVIRDSDKKIVGKKPYSPFYADLV